MDGMDFKILDPTHSSSSPLTRDGQLLSGMIKRQWDGHAGLCTARGRKRNMLFVPMSMYTTNKSWVFAIDERL
jgi:hypothetical protein